MPQPQLLAEAPSPEARIQAYISREYARVNGWMSRESARAIQVLSDAQVDARTRGGIGEIGVHHGRLLILLCLLLRPGEKAFAVDIFEDQELNVAQ